MKTIKFLIIFAIFAGFTQISAAQKKFEEIKIQTSAQCEMCKERIEKGLSYEKGVKKSDLSLETKIVTVTFSPKNTNPDKIRKAISEMGYDADQVALNKEAYEKLPPCCKKPDDPNSKKHN